MFANHFIHTVNEHHVVIVLDNDKRTEHYHWLWQQNQVKYVVLIKHSLRFPQSVNNAHVKNVATENPIEMADLLVSER